MPKKMITMVIVAIVSLCLGTISVFAKEVQTKNVGSVIDTVNSKTSTVYVIGDYAFTSSHILTTQDVMLAAKSINFSPSDGKTNEDKVYGMMAIYILKKEITNDGMPTGKWIVSKNLVGDSNVPDILNIRFVDYVEVKEQYRVTLNYDNDIVSSQTLYVNEGDTLNVEEPEKKGYNFLGWFEENSTIPFNLNTPITKNITLTAHWEPIKYTAKFIDDNGNSFTNIPEQQVPYGELVSRPTNPEREGYTFDGWYVDGVEYHFDTPIEDNIIIEAKWTVESYTINFYVDDIVYNTETVEYGKKVSEPIPPIKNGYQFNYWTKDNSEYNFNDNISGSFDLVAAFTIKNYTVTFDIGNGTGNIPSEVVQFGGFVSKPNDPTPEDGYEFIGWYLGDIEFNFDEITIGDNITLTAKYELKTYTVSFVADEVDIELNIETVKVKHGGKVTKPNDPVLDNYKFVNWYIENKNEPYNFEDPVNHDLVLHANFKSIINIDDLIHHAIAGLHIDDNDRYFYVSLVDGDIKVDVLDEFITNDTYLKDISNTGLVEVINELVNISYIKSVNVSFAGFTYNFVSAKDNEEDLRNQIKKLLVAVAEDKESYDNVTLNDLVESTGGSKGKVSITIEIDDDKVISQTESYTATYTLDFVSETVVVNTYSELMNALNNPEYTDIIIGKKIEISNTITIDRNVNIFGRLDKEDIKITNSNSDYVIVVADGVNVQLKNLTLEGAKQGLLVGSNATVSASNLDLSGNTDAGVEVRGTFTGENLTYDGEDYNHPVAWKTRGSSANVTIVISNDVDNPQYGITLDQYEKITIIDNTYDESYFTDATTGIYYKQFLDVNGNLLPEIQYLIDNEEHRSSIYATERTNRTHYYLDSNHSKLYNIAFWDTRFNLYYGLYVPYGEKIIVPKSAPINISGVYFWSFAPYTKTVNGVKEYYIFDGWALEKGGNDIIDIDTFATKGIYYYSHYKSVSEIEYNIALAEFKSEHHFDYVKEN